MIRARELLCVALRLPSDVNLPIFHCDEPLPPDPSTRQRPRHEAAGRAVLKRKDQSGLPSTLHVTNIGIACPEIDNQDTRFLSRPSHAPLVAAVMAHCTSKASRSPPRGSKKKKVSDKGVGWLTVSRHSRRNRAFPFET